jgi:1,2-phenylacetyl-CoA epoxidase PaaB subunit
MRASTYVFSVLYEYMQSLWNGVKKTLISNSARTTHSEITVIGYAQHREINNLFENTQMRIKIYRTNVNKRHPQCQNIADKTNAFLEA